MTRSLKNGMTHQQLTRLLAPLATMALLSSMVFAASGPDTTTPPVGQKAGKITALLPTAHVVRGAGKKAVTTDAVKGEDLIWQDLVKTDKGGRARITLNDQSILSLGSQAELRIVKHDARAQQTALEMTYGRIRAQVSSITRDGGSFQLRTPTAVAGVIGTDFGTDASTPGVTTLLCISGTVQVGNSDPSVPGTVPCTAGQTTTVKSGMPPTPPTPATQQQINQLIADTEPAVISAFAPASALVGATVDAVATGTHMSGINGVTIAGSGVQVTLGPNGTDTSVAAHLVIAPDAQPGPRAVTFTKPNGADTAAIFTVVAPPGLQGTDSASLQKRYTDILTTELQAADASNANIKSALQQEVDRGLQTIQQNNSKLPQPVPIDQVSQQLNNVVSGLSTSGTSRETQAYNAATAAVAQIVAAMLPKIQDGSEPAANIAADLDKQFAPINDAFQSALSQIHTDLASQSSTQIQSIDQLVANFQQTLVTAAQQQAAPPVPKVDSQDRSFESGFQASFDAGGSTALGGASVAGVSWVLCDPSYKPQQVGVVLPANAPACRAVPGFTSNGGQFQFDTCSLNPGDYTARVTVTDSNGKTSQMDVRLHVLQPGYDDPGTRLQGLANAYIALQSQQFVSFFDPTYPGLTQLQENVRNTFLSLDSMQINLRVSQSSVTCNTASLRADWQQIYTFKADTTCANAQPGAACQKVLFRQEEQLTARMTRTPGKGWFITDFQGDNGTVQGVAPGPQTTFTAQPSLQVTGLQVTASATQQSTQRKQRDTSVPAVGLAPGINHFSATVTNIGNAPLTQQPQLRFSVFDSNGKEIVGDTENLPTLPLNPNDSEVVNGTLTVPPLPPSTPVNVGANVNPGCVVAEQSCGAKNLTVLPAVAGTVDLAVTTITPTGQYVGTLNGTVNVTISNSGTAPSLASTGNLLLTSPDFSGNLGTADIPAVPASGSVIVPITFIVPNIPGLHKIAVTINPAAAGDNNPGNDSATGSLNFTVADAYAITSIASATTPNPPTGANALQVGQNVTVQITVANTGTTSPTGNITVQFNCTTPATCQLSTPPTATIAAPAAGKSAVATVTINNLQLPPAPGYIATATITSSPAESTTAGNSATVTFDVTDFTLTNTLGFTGDLNVQVGSQGFFNVTLTEPQGLAGINIPVVVTPAIGGVNYAVNTPLTPGTSSPVVILTNSTAPVGVSQLITVTGTRTGFGVSRTASQSVRFFTASLENFSTGQPGNSQNQPIILPINGAGQSINLRLSGNFFNPGGGAQLGFPTITGISFTPSQTTAAAGDVISVQMQAVQGAAVNQTIPIVFTAQVPNMNPPVPLTLTVFVRPTALPDLAVTSVAATGRNFSSNPWLSGEPLDFVVTVTNNGPGPSNGFENLHVLLNSSELTRGGVTVPQALQPNTSVNVTVHLDAPDPIVTGSSTVTAKVDEDALGDANPSNDSLAVSVSTSDWNLTIPPLPTGGPSGSTDTLALSVPAGGSSTTFVQPTISGSGDFLTPVSVLNGILSSRITATPGASSFTTKASPFSEVITAAGNAAPGLYAAQVIARFVDGGRSTAQRQATVHIGVNPITQGATVTVSSSRTNACSSGCTPVEINGLLIENLDLTVNPTSGQTAGSVDLHFTDPSSIVSDVTSSGAAQTPIINGVPYSMPKTVYFAAAQDATGAVSPGAASVAVSATSIQTSAARGFPTPDVVGTPTTLQFSVGDLALGAPSPACFNIPPGQSGTLTLNFSPLGGFNTPSISWSVTALPAGVALGSVTPTSTFNGSSYSPINIALSNNNPADITPSQPFTLVGTISNANGSASVIFAPTVQLHSGACVPGGVANIVVEGGVVAGGSRGVWRRGTASGAMARTNIIRDTSTATGDVRLVAGDVSYTPSLPKTGDTVQVRFRLTNAGTIEARDIPVALLVNGTVVVSDNFDVGAGKTVLGGLQWPNAQLPRTTTSGRVFAALVVDPAHNARASVASGKLAPLMHFEFAGAATGGAPLQAAAGGRQRALIEIAESACAGFRFSSGASNSCGSSDVEISFDDAASGRFSLRSNRGIADLGLNTSGNSAAGAQYTSQLIATAGHAYAVQLDGGRVGVLAIRAIRNPHQNSATADKVFHGGAAGRLAGKIGKRAGPVDTGEVSGAQTHDTVVAVLDVLYENP